MLENIFIRLLSISRELKIDIVDALVYGAVAAAKLKPLSLGGFFARCDPASCDSDISVYRPISQSSLARAIGLPR